jgi:hypothetical protein
MTEIAPSASYQRAGSSRPVLETTVGGVLREAAERAAGTMALVEGAPGPRPSPPLEPLRPAGGL